MAWGKNRRGSATPSASSSSHPSSSSGPGGRRRPPGEPTDQDIARSIQKSAVRVRVALQFGAVEDEAESLRDILTEFEQNFEARRGHAVTERRDVRVDLLECGLQTWQQLVELQRVLAALKRPAERGEQQKLMAKTMLRHDAKFDEWTLSLSFARASEDALWRFASSLMLRLKSCGVLAKVLLPAHRLMLPLESMFVEWGDTEIDRYQWEGQQVWSQVVLGVAGEQREEIQRVFLPPFREAALDPLAELRYPGLVTLVDGMLSGNADPRKPVVVILRGIPGSGKSTLGREIEAVCRHQGAAFTACSADFFFKTSRGYVFDVKKLGAAHSTCKGDFTRAVHGDIPRGHGDGKQHRPHQHVVLVDNTSTQRWEYEPYEDIARSHGSRVHIVEMKCPGAVTAFRVGQRNSHGVPPDKVVSMFLRWEEDPRAHCFTPQFEHATLSANPLSDGDVGGLTYLGLFLDADSQQKMVAQIPTVHPNKVADHVTLFYRPNKQYARDAELGAQFTVYGVEVIQDERGQTLRVELDERLPLQVRNKIPHITMSTTDGVSASYSNDLLDSTAATRTAVNPPIELAVRVGAALFIQNQRVITTTSPFAVDVAASDADNSCTTHGNEILPDMNTPTSSKLFILHISERDLVDDAEEATTKLLRRAQILPRMGSECKARRLLCIEKAQTSSSSPVSSLLNNVQARYLLSSTQYFDDVVVITQSYSFEGFGKTINKFLAVAGLGLTKQMTMLTTVEESMQWPLCEMKYFQDTALSVSYIGHKGVALRYNAALGPPCPTIFSVLDLLSINIEEQTRSAVLRGINTVGEAWVCVLGTEASAHDHALQRLDTTLLGLTSGVIELCLVLPSGTALSEVPILQMKLLSELDDARSVRHVVGGSSIPGLFYFSLCTASSYTPAFCVRMTTRSKDPCSAVDTNAFAQLEFCEHQLRSSRELCDIEAYSVLTALLRAILSSRCSSLLPSKCQLSSLINLVSERLVLQYFGSIDSSGGVESRPTAADVASGRIIFALYRMLTYLSKLDSDEWAATFGALLQALQGNEEARTAWRQAITNVMRNCTTVMTSHRCVGEDLKKESPLNPTDHLRVLVALTEANVDRAVGASSVRASIEVSSRLKWSQVHSLALCDKLRHAAAMVAPQDDDERNADSPDFFSCAPSLVARRVDVTASSLEELRNVMAKIHALEATGHDSEGALSGDYVIRRAETNEEVLVDLNRSMLE